MKLGWSQGSIFYEVARTMKEGLQLAICLERANNWFCTMETRKRLQSQKPQRADISLHNNLQHNKIYRRSSQWRAALQRSIREGLVLRLFISRTRDFEMNTITRNFILRYSFRSAIRVPVLAYVKITQRELYKTLYIYIRTCNNKYMLNDRTLWSLSSSQESSVQMPAPKQNILTFSRFSSVTPVA
jgi:hypothetical protein